MDNKYIIRTPEEAESLIRASFGFIPFIGQSLTEIIFDHRSRIKQKRLNKFVTWLAEGIKKEGNITEDQILTEDFGDLLETVLSKVSLTNNKNKLLRFRQILLNEIHNPMKDDINYKYLELVDNLNDIQFGILTNYCNQLNHLNNVETKLELLWDKEPKNKNSQEGKKWEVDNNSFLKERDKILEDLTYPLQYTSDLFNYLFFMQDMIAKGLFYTPDINRAKSTIDFKNVRLSPFASNFIKYIKVGENSK